jgi:hypothetical protein
MDVRSGGIESCNCSATHPDDQNTLIELALGPKDGASPSQRVIAEITPRWRNKMYRHGLDWRTDSLERAIKGKRVRIQGWLLLNPAAIQHSENTAPEREGNLRATAWQIHPITLMEILKKK